MINCLHDLLYVYNMAPKKKAVHATEYGTQSIVGEEAVVRGFMVDARKQFNEAREQSKVAQEQSKGKEKVETP